MTKRLYLFDTTLRDGAADAGHRVFARGQDFGRKHARRIRASTMSRAAIRAPTRPTQRSSPKAARATAKFVAFGMTKRAGRLGLERPGLCRAAAGEAGGRLLCRQKLGLPCAGRARLHQRGEPRTTDPRVRRGRASRRQGGAGRLRALLRRLQGQPRLCAGLREGPRSTPARAGWCCATPMAARMPSEIARHRRKSDRGGHSGKTGSASMRMTTPARRSPIRWPRSMPACARSRAR
jgi:hypothetical protein